MLITLAVVSPLMTLLPVRGALCTSPTPMCGGGGSPSPDFTISSTPSSIQLPVSSSGTFSITLTSFAGFTGSVTLSTTVSSTSLTTTFSPNPVSVPANSYGTTTLTVSTGAMPGSTYTVAVIGTSGSLSRSINVYVIIPFPSDPLYSNQWGPSDLNLPGAWAKTLGTNRLIIAIADSGIWFDHPDLKNNLWTASDGSHGVNFVGSTATTLSNCVPTSTNAADDFGHGTAVAGVVGATINNGVGVVGIVQEQIMSVKILDNTGNGSDASTACGIQWAADHGVNIIELSSGCPPPCSTPMEQSAVSYAWGKGVLIVASAGNDASNTVECPACYSQVIAVSALLQGDTALDTFSNYGTKVEFSAPGSQIYTTFWTGATDQMRLPKNCFVQNLAQPYCYHGGTSFAAPFVAGIAALAWDYNIQQGTGVGALWLSNQQVRDALDHYVVNLGCANCKPKPDASLLLNNIFSSHSYTLTAHWQFFSSSGTEPSATLWVYNVNANTYLIPGVQVGSTGQTLSILPGTELSVKYDQCYYDGSNNVSVNHVNSSGGPPSLNQNFFGYVMGAIPASTDSVYYVVVSC